MPQLNDELAPLQRRIDDAYQALIDAQNGGNVADVRCATAALDEAVAQHRQAGLRAYRLKRIEQAQKRRRSQPAPASRPHNSPPPPQAVARARQ